MMRRAEAPHFRNGEQRADMEACGLLSSGSAPSPTSALTERSGSALGHGSGV